MLGSKFIHIYEDFSSLAVNWRTLQSYVMDTAGKVRYMEFSTWKLDDHWLHHKNLFSIE